MKIRDYIVIDRANRNDEIVNGLTALLELTEKSYPTLVAARAAIDNGPEGHYLIAQIVDEATRETITRTVFTRRTRKAKTKKKGDK